MARLVPLVPLVPLVRAVSPGLRVCTVTLGRPVHLACPASRVTKEIQGMTVPQVRLVQRARKVMLEQSVWPDLQEPRVILARLAQREMQASAVQWVRWVRWALRVTPVRLVQPVPKGSMVRQA